MYKEFVKQGSVSRKKHVPTNKYSEEYNDQILKLYLERCESFKKDLVIQEKKVYDFQPLNILNIFIKYLVQLNILENY